MTNLNHGILIKMPISLPPLAEQQRIVERVNALLAQCDALEAMHKEQENKRTSARAAAMHALTMPQGNTDPAFAFSRNWGFLARHFEQLFTTKQDVAELRKTILQLAVMGKLTEQCESDEPASELLKKIAAEKKKLEKEGKIKKQKPLPPVGDGEKPYALPNGWEWVRLGDAGALERGKSKHRPRNDKKKFENGDIPFVQTGDVSKAKLSNSTILTCTGYYNALGLAQSQLQSKGVLCITIAANIAETGFLGFDACVPDSIVIFIDTNGAISSYVKIFIDTAKNHLEKYAPSTAQKNINLEILNLLAFPLPPLAEQQRIVERVNALMALCDTLEQNIDARAQTQTRLLDAVAAIA